MKDLSKRIDCYSFLTKLKPFQDQTSFIDEQIEIDIIMTDHIQAIKENLEELKKQRIIKAKITAFINQPKAINSKQNLS